MSASQELRVHGGPVELINTAMVEVEKVLKDAAPEEGPRVVAHTILRRIVGQAVLDAYMAGKADGKALGRDL